MLPQLINPTQIFHKLVRKQVVHRVQKTLVECTLRGFFCFLSPHFPHMKKLHKAGSITEEEFDVAYDSLAENNRPDIFVYGRNLSSDDHTLKKIKEKIFSYGLEYYVEYTSRDELRYLFYESLVRITLLSEQYCL